MCSKCEALEDLCVYCEQCVKRIDTSWQDPVVKLIGCLMQSRLSADTFYVISHNSRVYEAQFLIGSFL